IFLWHMAILSLAFPLLGVGLFDGSLWTMALVFVVTVAVTIPVAAISYALVEDPARRAVNRWWSGRLRDRG
ncbi:MAG: acyltransferase, partial [Corynebacterium sp.]|nr:acyltransferase [Corynebacterium sp.]